MPAKNSEWKPKLGILGNYTEENVAFARAEGFTSMILSATPGSTLNPTKLDEAQIESIRSKLSTSGIGVSALQNTQNHVAPDLERRARDNDYMVRVIELAGMLGVPYIGTASGKIPGRRLKEQAAEIARVYKERYFPACEKNHVRILWEPWPGGPNVATSPAGFEALFNTFGDSPYIGLQYDPSHLVWQMMDPIQTAREFADKIYDVHLKDTEIRWQVLRKAGIDSIDPVSWWRYRLPGAGAIDWAAFFTVLQDVGYQGALSIEHEDPLYGSPNHGAEFSEDFKNGFRIAHRYLRQYVPGS